jgi:hypothetical protein
MKNLSRPSHTLDSFVNNAIYAAVTIILKPVEEADAQDLFPLVYKSAVLNTILWNGPASLEDLKKGLKEREEHFKNGLGHQFTVLLT